EVAKLCREKDALLMIDEVQTGNGRTGSIYAFMQYDITPDVVTTAKGLGGGLPIGACIIGEKAENVLTPSSHGSTFGGNPICAAGAVHVFSRLTPELLEGVKEREALIRSTLQDAPGVKEISGMGLMLGITPTEKSAKEIVNEALSKGVLVLTAKEKVRLLPALNIPMEQLTEALSVLKEIFA
ncbi:MAG: aminotransferase class III-fold pyridoxal phosphate-dependent enzyme, partial [Clostridia bacterium]|nr:aminotransferase class III-fold pyridoxal phosphate-dependent enzyme [Clostridia bacterium]